MTLENDLKELFAERAAGVDAKPELWDEVEAGVERARARARRGRMIVSGSVAAAVVLLGAIAAVVVATPSIEPPPALNEAIACKNCEITPGTRPGWIKYRDFSYGWTMEFPSQWHLQPVAESMRPSMVGAIVSNLDRDLQHPDLGPNMQTSAWDTTGLPESRVIVALEYVDHPIASGPCRVGPPPELTPSCPPDTPLPLSMETTREPCRGREHCRSEVEGLFRKNVVARSDSHYLLTLWKGSQASAADLQIAKHVIGSIRFLPLGTFAPGVPQDELATEVHYFLEARILGTNPVQFLQLERRDDFLWLSALPTDFEFDLIGYEVLSRRDLESPSGPRSEVIVEMQARAPDGTRRSMRERLIWGPNPNRGPLFVLVARSLISVD